MLFDGAIRFCKQALAGFDHDDPLQFNQTINNNLLRAQSILHELSQSLDLQQGGELAATLRGLYDYMDRRLTESNLRKTSTGIHETIERLETLQGAWQEMLTQQNPSVLEPEITCAGLSACV
jgi:flagellar secretion chaperone FliS